MNENQIDVSETSQRSRRWRYLIDIIALVVATLLLDAVLGAFIHVPINWETDLSSTPLGKCYWSELRGD
jgi:uncharacterized Tic20 family protein